MKSVCAILVLISICFAQFDDSWYVSLSGNDHGACGKDINDPCFTLKHCLSLISNDNETFGYGQIFMFGGIYKGDGNCGINATTSLFITGMNATQKDETPVIIDCEGTSRHFAFTSTSSFLSAMYLSNIELRNGKGDNGGCIKVDGVKNARIQISNTTFRNCQASGAGGAIAQYGASSLVLTAVSFLANTASNGGAIYSEGASMFMSVTFTANTATANGGAVYSTYSSQIDAKCSFTENHAGHLSTQTENAGGALYLILGAGSDQTTVHGSFNENTASRGGAIFVTSLDNQATCLLAGTSFLDNAAERGGAIFIDQYSQKRVIVYGQEVTAFDNSAVEGGFIFQPTNATSSYFWQLSKRANFNNTAELGSEVFLFYNGFSAGYNQDNATYLQGLTFEGTDSAGSNDSALFCDANSKQKLVFCNPCGAVTKDCSRNCDGVCLSANGSYPGQCYSSRRLDCDHGKCYWDNQKQLMCSCDAGFTGTLCDASSSSTTPFYKKIWFIAVVAGGASLLVLVVVVVAVVRMRNRRHHYQKL